MDPGDIEKAQPCTRTFRTQRVVNPLEPVYALASCELAGAPAARFLRDATDVSDIEGCAVRAKREVAVRDPLLVADLAQKRRTFASESAFRGTDPLRPVYRVHDMTVEDDAKTRPRGAVAAPRGKPNLALDTSDIEGAQADTVASVLKCKARATYVAAPVEGAQADTLERGLQSKRNYTHPLAPAYVLLDGTQGRAVTAPDTSRIERAQRERAARNTRISNAPLQQVQQVQQEQRQQARREQLQAIPHAVPEEQHESKSEREDNTVRASGRVSPRQPAALLAPALGSSRAAVLPKTASVPLFAPTHLPAQHDDAKAVLSLKKQVAHAPSPSPAAQAPPPAASKRAPSSGAPARDAGPKLPHTAEADRFLVQALPEAVSETSFLFPSNNSSKKSSKD